MTLKQDTFLNFSLNFDVKKLWHLKVKLTIENATL